MNVTVHGIVYHVTTEQELLALLGALTTLHALACGRAA